MKPIVEGLVSLVAAAGVEKTDQGLDGIGLLEVTSEVGTLVSCEMRGTGEAAAGPGWQRDHANPGNGAGTADRQGVRPSA